MINKLYKFRSIDRALDVLKEGFWFSSFEKLNDPMEGLFYYYKSNQIMEELIKKKRKRGICSFSESLDNPLMWSFYADEGKGICLEVSLEVSLKEIEKNNSLCFAKNIKVEKNNSLCFAKNIKVEKINYTNDIKLYKDFNGINVFEEADKLLLQKLEPWKNEKEWRGLVKFNEIDKNGVQIKLKVDSIYLGYRISNLNDLDKIKKLLKKDKIDSLKEIFKICVDKQMKIYKTDYSVKKTENNIVSLTGKVASEQLNKEEISKFMTILCKN